MPAWQACGLLQEVRKKGESVNLPKWKEEAKHTVAGLKLLEHMTVGYSSTFERAQTLTGLMLSLLW